MTRPVLLLVAVAASLLFTSCAPEADPTQTLPTGSAQPSEAPGPSESPAAETLTNDDPRCKLWSSPLIMVQVILHPVKDVARYPVAALDATCRWEVAGGTDTVKYPHSYEALWLDADDATFDRVAGAFQSEGAVVAVDESGGPGAAFGWLTYAAITSPDGTGEMSLRPSDMDFPNPYIAFRWTRA